MAVSKGVLGTNVAVGANETGFVWARFGARPVAVGPAHSSGDVWKYCGISVDVDPTLWAAEAEPIAAMRRDFSNNIATEQYNIAPIMKMIAALLKMPFLLVPLKCPPAPSSSRLW